MSAALIEMGFEKPKKQMKFSFKEACIGVAWAALVVMVGLSVASSIQVKDQVAYNNAPSLGL